MHLAFFAYLTSPQTSPVFIELLLESVLEPQIYINLVFPIFLLVSLVQPPILTPTKARNGWSMDLVYPFWRRPWSFEFSYPCIPNDLILPGKFYFLEGSSRLQKPRRGRFFFSSGGYKFYLGISRTRTSDSCFAFIMIRVIGQFRRIDWFKSRKKNVMAKVKYGFI